VRGRLQDIVIPEADHKIAQPGEGRRAIFVAKRLVRLVVAAAIELDNETSSGAAEVGDIDPEPVLTPKFPTV